MSGWSRTVKPTADKTIDSANVVYGVDQNEVAATPGITAPGWAVRRTVGTRVIWETLVAMRTPPVEDNADDSVLPDILITLVGPVDVTVAEGDNTTFSVAVTTSPATSNLTYLWQFSADGETFTNTSGNITGNTSNVLTITDSTGLDGYSFRVTVTTTDDGNQKVSDAAVLTVTE